MVFKSLGDIHGVKRHGQAAHGSLGMKPTMKANTSQPSIQACLRKAHGSQVFTGATDLTEAAMETSAERVCARHCGEAGWKPVVSEV